MGSYGRSAVTTGQTCWVTTPFVPAEEQSNWTRLLILNRGRFSPINQVLRAVGATIVNMDADDSRGKRLLQTPRRFVPELRGIPVGSLLENITMPQLRISEFDWLDTLKSVPQDIRSALQEVESG